MKKPGVAIILGNIRKAKGGGADGDASGPSGPSAPPAADGDLQTVAGDILQAIQNQDAEALAGALGSFMDIYDKD